MSPMVPQNWSPRPSMANFVAMGTSPRPSMVATDGPPDYLWNRRWSLLPQLIPHLKPTWKVPITTDIPLQLVTPVYNLENY